MKKILIRLFQLFILLVIRIKFYGRVKFHSRDLKFKGPIVIASNHASELDPFIIGCFLPLKTFFKIYPYAFMTANVYYYRWWKPFAYLAGCYPAKPKNARSKPENYGVDASVKLLNEGFSVVMFPEGKRTRKQIEARPGISRILQKSKMPLVLCHIAWSRRKDHLYFEFATEMANTKLDRNDPQAIMNAAYSIPLASKPLKIPGTFKELPNLDARKVKV